MKKLAMFLVMSCTVLALAAQNYTGTVTINVMGERNKEVLVDGRSYTVNKDASSTTAVNLPIAITGLTTGQHTLEVKRVSRYNTTGSTSTTSTFTLRNGYDMDITIKNDGSVQISESRIRRTKSTTGVKTPMDTESFNALLVSIQRMRTTGSKVTAINNAFNTTANYFTTSQARQLIGMISSQTTRVNLAKASYKTITDPENFTQLINNMIVSQAGRRDLESYVLTYNQANQGTVATTTTTHTAMTEANFNALYSDVQGQWPASARTTYLTNVFASKSNYFTTAQVKQLIEVVYPENERLALAKAAFDNVVDPANYTQVNDLLHSQASRNELASFTGNSNSGTVVNPRSPMSSANFNSMYLAARDKWSATDKIAYISSAFANTSNYFTTTQVRQLIQLVNTENDRLTLAKSAWDNLTDPANASQLYDLFPSTAYRNDFTTFVNSNGTYTGTVIVPMSQEKFNAFYNTVSNTWGLGAKMSVLTDAFNVADNYYTVSQLKQLIPLVSSETNRLTLGKLAFNNAVDPQNYSQLYELLASETSRNELDVFVKANSNTSTGYTPVKTAMSGDSFTALYNNISNTWGLGAKMSALTDVFANASNYFTTVQAKQLIQLVSSETNRLQLAKSGYDNLVDPDNFTQLYDLFTSQVSRNELAAYVSSYSYNR